MSAIKNNISFLARALRIPNDKGMRDILNEVDGAIDSAVNGAQAAAVADLNQTIGTTPTQAEVQAISDKVDELLAALRASGLLAS